MDPMTAQRALAALQGALQQALLPPLITAKPMGGGCIHRVYDLTLRDGTHVAAKMNDASMRQMFDEEATSLTALRDTHTVKSHALLACTCTPMPPCF
jgi:fructosamine-3-kinase